MRLGKSTEVPGDIKYRPPTGKPEDACSRLLLARPRMATRSWLRKRISPGLKSCLSPRATLAQTRDPDAALHGFHVPSIDQSVVVVWSQGSLACRREQFNDRGVGD